MITFRQYIVEAFDNPYPYRVTEHSSDTYEVTLEPINGNIYYVTFERSAAHMFDLTFARSGITPENGWKLPRRIFVIGTKIDINPARLFATVGDVLKTFMTNNPQLHIEFIADMSEPSRVKLYDKLAALITVKTGAHVRIKRIRGEAVYHIEPIGYGK